MKKQKNKYRRLFLALWPEPDVRRQIQDCQQRLKLLAPLGQNLKLVREENLHLTLRFLGAIAEDLIESLCARLDEVRHNAFELQLQGLGYFAGSRTLWLGLKEAQSELLYLVEKLDHVLLQSLPEYKADSKNYIAHVSLSRDGDMAVETAACAAIRWSVSEFALVESINTSDGVIYSVLRHWSLTQQAPPVP